MVRNLLLLVYPRDGTQTESVELVESRCLRKADIGFIRQYIQAGVRLQQSHPGFQIHAIGWRQFKVQNQPVQRDEHLQATAKNGMLFGNCSTATLLVGFPIRGESRGQVKLHSWVGQSVDNALLVVSPIQTMQNELRDQIDRPHQVELAAIESTLGRNIREQSWVVFPNTQQFGFHTPTATFPYQAPGNQPAFRTMQFWTWAKEESLNLLLNFLHYNKHPVSKIFKIHDHQGVLQLVRYDDRFLSLRRILC